ncbi:MAG: ATP-binding protein [Cryomorphaceae bacterium]|nr:ATP-binding protein [Cryomorphaceae bacterium]
MPNPKRIVLTGSPSSGKTTIIEALQTQGHHCLPEVSREIIQHALDNNTNITPWQDLATFSQRVLEKRLQQFNLVVDGWNFYDRSLIDILAYQYLDGQKIEPTILNQIKQHTYDLIFIARPWKEIFTNDGQRKEDWKNACAIDEALMHTYLQFGYLPVIIPEGTVAERTQFVINTTENALR